MHQAGCLPSSLYLSFETKMSKVLHHISSLRLSLSSRWWRGIRSCLEFAHCIMFSGCLRNCLSDLREVSGRHLSSSGKQKLIAISQKHEPEPRTVEKWSTHFKRAGAFYIISSCLFFYWLKFHTLLFLFIHEASHWYLFEIHIFYQLLLIAYTLVDSWLFSSTHARP